LPGPSRESPEQPTGDLIDVIIQVVMTSIKGSIHLQAREAQ
jgi:hypothetical protein